MATQKRLYDSEGKEYIAIVEESRIPTTTLDDSHHRSIGGLRSLRLADGRRLSPAGEGKYRIVDARDERILSVEKP
jgi:hypothetical protein